MHSREIGALAEEAAACLLAMKGYDILERGFRFRRKEIDIIAAKGDAIVFVEVKFRRTGRCGAPREAVDPRKRQRIIFAARGFLVERGLSARPCRFDVLEVRLSGGGLVLEIEHLVGAFGENW